LNVPLLSDTELFTKLIVSDERSYLKREIDKKDAIAELLKLR